MKRWKQKEEAFRDSSVREAIFAGKSYEGDPERLHVQMEAYFQDPKGPGLFGLKAEERTLRGVVARTSTFKGEDRATLTRTATSQRRVNRSAS